MAKFYGNIGFAITSEIRPGVYKKQIQEYPYYGDLVKSSRRLEQSGKVNDDINLTNDISILADPFARENFHTMQYVEYLGTKWRVSGVEVQYPRLILSTGGVYNENST